MTQMVNPSSTLAEMADQMASPSSFGFIMTQRSRVDQAVAFPTKIRKNQVVELVPKILRNNHCSSFIHYLLVRKSCEDAKIWVQIKTLVILFTEFYQANQYPSSIWATIQLLNIRKSIHISLMSDSLYLTKSQYGISRISVVITAPRQSLIKMRSWLKVIISMQRILTGFFCVTRLGPH